MRRLSLLIFILFVNTEAVRIGFSWICPRIAGWWVFKTVIRRIMDLFGASISCVYRLPYHRRVQYFQAVRDNQDWQFGDLITFDLLNSGHAMAYIGTDEETGHRLVFTKNGHMRSPFHFNSYDGILRVNHFRVRQSFKLPSWPRWALVFNI